VSSNPNCTREDVARGTGIKSSTATARTKELIDEGFLFETGERSINRSGTSAKCLQASSRKQGGKALDKVRVEVTLTIDCNGVYGARVHVVGGKPSLAIAHPIKSQRYTLTAPHPRTYKDVFDTAPVATLDRMSLEANADDIIDADFTILTD
jgi:hypothetical protein